MAHIIWPLSPHLPSFAKLVSVGRKRDAKELTNEANCYKSDFWRLISESHETRGDWSRRRIFSQLE